MITGIIASLVSVHFLTLMALAAHDHLLSYDVHITVTDRLIINSTKKNYRGL